jgi:Protein of unknown function (DUF2914)
LLPNLLKNKIVDFIAILVMIRAMIRCALHIAFCMALLLSIGVVNNSSAQVAVENLNADVTPNELHLAHGVMCEAIESYKPVNPSAVFSVSRGKLMCFTEFDIVPHQTDIFHNWIKHGELVFRKRLVLKPPRWSSVSSIQLREADKGPWRMEIRGADGQLLKLLRFSITD